MGFRLRRGFSWGNLITAVVIREDDLWAISSWIDARLDAGEDFRTLDDLLQAADRLVSDGYPIGPSRTTAELQYAIYPWTFKGEPQAILDVTGHPGDLAATDIIGSNLEIHGTTAGELVTQVPAGREAAGDVQVGQEGQRTDGHRIIDLGATEPTGAATARATDIDEPGQVSS